MHSSRIALGIFVAASLALAACSEASPSSLSRAGDDESVGDTTTTKHAPMKKATDGDDAVGPSAVGGTHRRVYRASHEAPKKRYPTGLLTSPPGKAKAAKRSNLRVQADANELPPSVDLTGNAPAAANQGNTSACGTFATGYALMGWWAKTVGMPGAPYAPMFLYSLQAEGDCANHGTFIEDNMDILRNFGIPSDTAYQPMQSQLDCVTQPTQAAANDAAAHRVASYDVLDLSGSKALAIAQYLAAGVPVVIGMQTYNAIFNASQENWLVDQPMPGEQSTGGHAVTVFAYDQNGLWFLNSWGEEWGWQGWAQLSWDFVDGAQGGIDNINSAAAATDVQR